jgi:hypothetical protein
MADLNKGFLDRILQGGVPDSLAFLGPLFGLMQKNNPAQPPDLADFGVDASNLGAFFRTKRNLAAAGLQRGGARAKRSAAAALPSGLQFSTVPASIGAGIDTQVSEQVARSDAEIAGQEFGARTDLYNMALQRFGIQEDLKQRSQERDDNFLDVLSLLPLVL